MRIVGLNIRNFRSLSAVDLLVRPLTVLIGPNGAGKTALLDVFQALQSGSQQKLGAFLDAQGGIQALLSHQGVLGDPPCLQIDVELDAESDRSDAPMFYRLGLLAQQVGYAVEHERLEWQYDPYALQPFRYIDRLRDRVLYNDPATKKMTPPSWEFDHLELALAQVPKMYREPEALRGMLASTQHFSFLDVRQRSLVRLPQSLTPATRPGPNGESLYSALYNVRASHHDIYDRIQSLLEQGFPGFERIEFPVVGAGQVTMTWHEHSSRTPFYPNQLSEGMLRFLWLITTLLAPPPPAMMLLDEPEVSLHPELLKLLAAVLQDASARSQVVVATHSPDLIRWLQPDQVLIADKEEGRTRFTWADALDLDHWLADYTLSELWLMGTLGGRP